VDRTIALLLHRAAGYGRQEYRFSEPSLHAVLFREADDGADRYAIRPRPCLLCCRSVAYRNDLDYADFAV